MNRNQLHQLVDELPEQDLAIVARVMQGLRATSLLTPPPARSVPPSVEAQGLKGQLAHEYGRLMRQEPAENSNMLRKVMFTPLSELLSWVNQPSSQPSPQPSEPSNTPLNNTQSVLPSPAAASATPQEK